MTHNQMRSAPDPLVEVGEVLGVGVGVAEAVLGAAVGLAVVAAAVGLGAVGADEGCAVGVPSAPALGEEAMTAP